MTKEDQLKNILINENAYFYKNISNVVIAKWNIIEVFRDASSFKMGNYLLKEVKKSHILNGEQIKYSFCVFKYQTKPTFIDEEIHNWFEVKLGYLLIVEIREYIIISRKNSSNIQNFIKQFQVLDYKVLSTLFVNDDTSFEKFSLKNLNVSDNAIREKSIEAIDLKENFSALGASNYMLSSMRVKNNDVKTSLILNSSRINKFGKKNSIERFCDWSFDLVDEISGHVEHDTFLSVFAEPQDYEILRSTLIPISILFNFGSLINDFEYGRIDKAILRIEYSDEIKNIEIDIIKYLSAFERLCKIESFNNSYKIQNKTAKDLEIRLNDKSITLKSEKLKKVLLIKDNGIEQSIIDYLNTNSGFIINFENIDLAYSNRKLFKDNKLLGNIDHFIKVFSPYNELQTTNSEKGNFNSIQTQFEVNSTFRFVEDTFSQNVDYFICDDLGKEWADHIGVTSNKITFYHSKHKDSKSSASAFQDIVAQALKNLGNLSPQDFQLESKRAFWSSQYNSGTGIQTNINRLRVGGSVNNAIDGIKNAIKNPYFDKEVYLVVDFISKSELKLYLHKLKNSVNFAQKNEALQILWLISSLISGCKELNTNVTICCKP